MCLAIFVACTTFIACSDDDETAGNKTDISDAIEVTVLFSPNGFGDSGYNDYILYGMQRSYLELGYDFTYHVPDDVETGMEIYEAWRTDTLADGCKKSLFVFASSEYVEAFTNASRPTDDRKDILLFESTHAVEGAYTFYLGMYGIGYTIGALCHQQNTNYFTHAAVIAANQHDPIIKRAIDGLTDGFTEAGGTACDTYYLGNTATEGYNLVEEAYQLSAELEAKGYTYLFPVAGGSNLGVYRYSRETTINTIGMDGDMRAFSLFITYSLVKRIDLALEDFMEQWVDGTEIPQHQRFLYDSGYLEMAYEYSEYMEEEDLQRLAEIEQKAKEKELEYEDNMQ